MGYPQNRVYELCHIMHFLFNDKRLGQNRLDAAKMAYSLAGQIGINFRFLPYFAKNAEKMTFRKGLV